MKRKIGQKPVHKVLAAMKFWEDCILRGNIEAEACAILEAFYQRVNTSIHAVAYNMKEGAKK